jgi:hypothetical protein
MRESNWVYHLENKNNAAYHDDGFLYLLEIGSYLYFDNRKYIVQKYTPLDKWGRDYWDDCDFIVFCVEVDNDLDYKSLIRDIKLKELGL